MSFLLSACGGGSDDPAPPLPNPPSQTNTPPVANAGSDQTAQAGSMVTLSGSATDANGSIASYAWTQTAGPSIALTGSNAATATFVAPAEATSLTFRLTATDNQGATHADDVVVTVTAAPPPPPPVTSAPAIVRQPTNPMVHEYGSALLFVVASGQELNYEWRSESFGTVIKSGPEPFLLRQDLVAAEDGRCYTVTISNSLGSVTSEEGCTTVVASDYVLQPDDDHYLDDDLFASTYGNALMQIVQLVAGTLTGPTSSGTIGVPVAFPGTPVEGQSCGYSGRYFGATIDGEHVAGPSFLPLGHHTISKVWDNDCRSHSDQLVTTMGGMLITYEFPEAFGVGSVTFHMSGYQVGTLSGDPLGWMNGSFTATFERTLDGDGHRVDDIDIEVADGFSFAGMRSNGGLATSIGLTRDYDASETIIERAVLDFRLIMSVFGRDGYEGPAFQGNEDVIVLRHEPDGGEDGSPGSSIGEFEVDIGPAIVGGPSYNLATLTAVLGVPSLQWGFEVEPHYECPEGQICIDPLP